MLKGDFWMENKIRSTFGSIPAPEVPTQKIEYKLPGNVEPLVGILTDPEAENSSVEVIWKTEPLPKELNNTDAAYVQSIIKAYVRLIMSERFSDIASKPGSPFLGASFGAGGLYTQERRPCPCSSEELLRQQALHGNS